MLALLTGTIISQAGNTIVLLVGEFGFEIYTGSLFQDPVWLRQQVTVYTHLKVKEEAVVLYGFLKAEQRRVFKLLLNLPRVGYKLAFMIASSLQLNELAKVVADQNIASLSSLPGMGKKTAQNLLLALQSNREWQQLVASELKLLNIPKNNSKLQLAIESLQALGYKAAEIARAVAAMQAVAPEGIAELAASYGQDTSSEQAASYDQAASSGQDSSSDQVASLVSRLLQYLSLN